MPVMPVTFFLLPAEDYHPRIGEDMFEDIFDHNWELALLIHEQYQAGACRDRLRLRRTRRILEIVKNARRELPNWQEVPASAVSICVN
jgi:hypothetical protein